MVKKYEGVAIGAFLVAFSVFMYFSTFSIKKLTESSVGSQFVPQLVAGGIFICSVALIAVEWKKIKAVTIEKARLTSEAEEAESAALQPEIANYKAVASTIALIIGYIVLLPYVGFAIMTALYLLVQMLLLTERTNWKIGRFAIIAVVTSVFIYYIFRTLFHVMLPAGILG